MTDTEGKLALLLETTDPIEADVIKTKLESFGIPCLLKRESVGFLYGVMIDGLAAVRILVPEESLELARAALEPEEEAPPEETSS